PYSLRDGATFRRDPNPSPRKASRQIGYDLAFRSFDEADQLLRRLLLAGDDAGPQRSLSLRRWVACDLRPNRHSSSVRSSSWPVSRARLGFAGRSLPDLFGLRRLFSRRLEVLGADPAENHARGHDHVLGLLAAEVEAFEDALVAHRLGVLLLLALGPADKIVC